MDSTGIRIAEKARGVPAPVRDGAVYRSGSAASPRTLIDILRHSVAAWPTALAVDDGDIAYTYRELDAVVTELADELRSSGIGRGDRVGVRMPSGSAGLYTAILAVLATGAAYVPVDADDPDERARLVWDEAAVCAVIGAGHTLTPRPATAPGARPGRPAPGDDAWIIFTPGPTAPPKGVAGGPRSAAGVGCPARPVV
uniref:AMP-binding protein n=1 Tax=Streptomyces specialis TaxID=498367 RepID=UPI000A89065D